MGQTVIEFEIGGILAEIRGLTLESVVLIEELEMPFSACGDRGVIGVEGQLCVQRLADGEKSGQRQQEQNTFREQHG